MFINPPMIQFQENCQHHVNLKSCKQWKVTTNGRKEEVACLWLYRCKLQDTPNRCWEGDRWDSNKNEWGREGGLYNRSIRFHSFLPCKALVATWLHRQSHCSWLKSVLIFFFFLTIKLGTFMHIIIPEIFMKKSSSNCLDVS